MAKRKRERRVEVPKPLPGDDEVDQLLAELGGAPPVAPSSNAPHARDADEEEDEEEDEEGNDIDEVTDALPAGGGERETDILWDPDHSADGAWCRAVDTARAATLATSRALRGGGLSSVEPWREVLRWRALGTLVGPV